jgi:hypothetical protein
MRGEDSVKAVWRLGEGPSSESRPNETNLGRGRPDSDSLVSIGGGFGTERLEEMELASEMVSSLSRRRVLDGMLAVVGGLHSGCSLRRLYKKTLRTQRSKAMSLPLSRSAEDKQTRGKFTGRQTHYRFKRKQILPYEVTGNSHWLTR